MHRVFFPVNVRKWDDSGLREAAGVFCSSPMQVNRGVNLIDLEALPDSNEGAAWADLLFTLQVTR